MATPNEESCKHLEAAAHRDSAAEPTGPGCMECLQTGSQWVHLRLCLACGHVGCCDNSPNQHATKHFHITKHPVIRSFEPRESWAYCYIDDEMLERLAPMGHEAAPRHFSSPPPEARL